MSASSSLSCGAVGQWTAPACDAATNALRLSSLACSCALWADRVASRASWRWSRALCTEPSFSSRRLQILSSISPRSPRNASGKGGWSWPAAFGFCSPSSSGLAASARARGSAGARLAPKAQSVLDRCSCERGGRSHDSEASGAIVCRRLSRRTPISGDGGFRRSSLGLCGTVVLRKLPREDVAGALGLCGTIVHRDNPREDVAGASLGLRGTVLHPEIPREDVAGAGGSRRSAEMVPVLFRLGSEYSDSLRTGARLTKRRGFLGISRRRDILCDIVTVWASRAR
mmetsp:Transcript_10381/g.30486  ORF Transcript_10381/g.30486 Transcript_10381/m.30486 type:complete len:285 (-) Transcript_10381:1653-2507(-)